MSVAVTGTTPTPFGFAGQHGYQNDSVTGLMRLGHRFYDASVGRFLSRDPIRDGYNWYAYVNNDPVNGVDPEGQKPKKHVGVRNLTDRAVPIVFDVDDPSSNDPTRTIVIRIDLPPGYETNPDLLDIDFVKTGPNIWRHIMGPLFPFQGNVIGDITPYGSKHVSVSEDTWGNSPNAPNAPDYPDNMGVPWLPHYRVTPDKAEHIKNWIRKIPK
jgi:RHS repeat-associated protein